MKIKYEWRELSDDGLLKNLDNGLGYDYDTEDQAAKHYAEYNDRFSYGGEAPRCLVLVKKYYL